MQGLTLGDLNKEKLWEDLRKWIIGRVLEYDYLLWRFTVFRMDIPRQYLNRIRHRILEFIRMSFLATTSLTTC